MSTELESPLPIFRISVAEVNLTYVNGLPQVAVKLHFLTAEGNIIGETTYSALSESSWKLIDMLSKDLEKGFRDNLLGESFFQWNEEPENSGINYVDNSGEWK